MKSWLEPSSITVSEALREAVGGHAVVAESLARRGMTTPEAARRFLNPAVYLPAAPHDLPDMDRAISRLQRAIHKRESILVWGDFDVDGQTSTALLVSALRDLGANVAYHIPNRFTEGHGIHLGKLKTLLDGGVNLIVTCDTGITAHEAIDYIRSRGVDVIITDHHALPESLPQAYAAINPMRLPVGHPLRELPGVGTAYKLIEALYGAQPCDHLLDLVAVGIVADVMVLADDTRWLLQRGLEVLRSDPRPGLKAMLERAEIPPADLTENELGFAIAPRLNALGRLADATPAVELLTTTDKAIIAERVNELEGLNQKRRFLTRQVYEAARQKIQADPALLKYAALVISGEGWHTGVVGIVASRLAEEYGCPVVVLSENDGLASGSARSVSGCNMVKALRTQADLLNTYGGHSMAAGLSLPAEQLFAFRRGLSQTVRETLGKTEVEPQLQLDAYVDLPELDLDFAEDIARLAPFGNGNPPLALATRSVRVKSRRTMGSRGDHLELRIEDEDGHEQRVIWWFGDLHALPPGLFDLAYTVRPNVFNGKREALVEWLDVRPVGDALVVETGKPAYDVVDYRQHRDPQAALKQVIETYEDVLIWREGAADIEGVDRHHLRGAETLVVWSAPPDPLTWQAALQIVQPQTLVLFGNPSPFNRPDSLLEHVGGLLKYAVNRKGGVISVSEFAALAGQREQTIAACLTWFRLNTPMHVTAVSEDVFHIEMMDSPPERPDQRASERLTLLLAETNAYRQFWLKQGF